MAQKPYSPFDHASHNLKAHEYLKQSNQFKDWQITTAFYTALKFFEGSLFPNEFLVPSKESEAVKKEFKTYNEYKRDFTKMCSGTPHDAMKSFVMYNTNQEVWFYYNDLYNSCHSSRYKNYIVEDNELEMAIQALSFIKNYCINNQN